MKTGFASVLHESLQHTQCMLQSKDSTEQILCKRQHRTQNLPTALTFSSLDLVLTQTPDALKSTKMVLESRSPWVLQHWLELLYSKVELQEQN